MGIIGVVTIPLAYGYFNSRIDNVTSTITAHSDSNVAALKQTMTESYETQAAHKLDIDAMTSWNKTMALGQQNLSDKFDKNNVETRLAIQHLGDQLDHISPN